MAGFVAKKLCPELIQLPLNFDKYRAKATEVRAILGLYDPRFESASIDEAYLNITEYCEAHDMSAFDVVQELRQEVANKTHITISAGIAPNARLAKIASNQNKPNGQYEIKAEREAVMNFMRDLPVRKVNGIGRVLERELGAIGVHTCGDVFTYRGLLALLFGVKAFNFLMACHLGVGTTEIRPAEEYERKSIGTESTFGDMTGLDDLKVKLKSTAEELQNDAERVQFKGRTLCLKVKLSTFEVLSRQVVLPGAMYKAEDLYTHSLPMLIKLNKDIPGMTIRLMGLRLTGLIDLKKTPRDIFATARRATSLGSKRKATELDEASEWESWPSDSEETQPGTDSAFTSNEARSGLGRSSEPGAKPSHIISEVELWDCPVCGISQAAVEREFNTHVDFCLSKQAIRDAIREHEVNQPLSATSQSGRADSFRNTSSSGVRSQHRQLKLLMKRQP
jgi:DNA polymerase kappa